MYGSDQFSADGKPNLRKRKFTAAEMIRKKLPRTLDGSMNDCDFTRRLNDVPNYRGMEICNRNSTKKSLLNYITFMDQQISVGWIPSYYEVWHYCSEGKYLDPEIISILLEDKTFVEKTQSYRYYISGKLNETCRACRKVYDSFQIRELKKKATTALCTAPKRVIYRSTEFGASLEMLEHFAEQHNGLPLGAYSGELPMLALKMGRLDFVSSYAKKYGAKCFEEMNIPESEFFEKNRPSVSYDEKIIPDLIYTVVSGLDKARLKDMADAKSICFSPIFQKWTLAHFAAATPNSTFLELLLKKYGLHCLFYKTADDDRLLHVAARAGRLSNVKLILETLHVEHEKILEQEAESYEALKNSMHDNEANDLPMSREHRTVHALLQFTNSDCENALEVAAAYGRNKVVDILLAEYETNRCVYRKKIGTKTSTYAFQEWFWGRMEDYDPFIQQIPFMKYSRPITYLLQRGQYRT